jgi:predicted ATPase
MLGDEERKRIHYSIGTWMLENEKADADIFEVANHLNESRSFVISADDKNRLCQLNYEAGQKAKNSSAYEKHFTIFRRLFHIGKRYMGKEIFLLLFNCH